MSHNVANVKYIVIATLIYAFSNDIENACKTFQCFNNIKCTGTVFVKHIG